MVDPEISQAIEIIDRKILSLQQARNQLALAFGITLSPIGTSLPPLPSQAPMPPMRQVVPGQKPRKIALAEFLIEHGSMSRSDIVARCGLPEGTISYCLSDKRFFIQLPNGDWGVTDYSRNGLPKEVGLASDGQQVELAMQ